MEEKKRPIGISILAVGSIVVGILGGVLTILALAILSDNPEAKQRVAAFGLPPVLWTVAIVSLFALPIALGAWMWMGKKWGWYLISFLCMYNIMVNANALITIPTMLNSIPPDQLANMAHSPQYYYVKCGFTLVTNFLCYVYLFKGNVREFFSLSDQKKWKPILVEMAICLIIAGVVNAFLIFMT